MNILFGLCRLGSAKIPVFPLTVRMIFRFLIPLGRRLKYLQSPCFRFNFFYYLCSKNVVCCPDVRRDLVQQLIKSLLKQGEGEQLEFKEIVRKDAVGKTICAFLNNKGGQLLIGISNDKKWLALTGQKKYKMNWKHIREKKLFRKVL